jgi:hypothetical protein
MESLTQTIQSWFEDFKELAQIIAPIVAFLGFVGLGIMYMGSSLPIISTWRQSNPQAATQVVMGLFFVIIASGVASVISFT